MIALFRFSDLCFSVMCLLRINLSFTFSVFSTFIRPMLITTRTGFHWWLTRRDGWEASGMWHLYGEYIHTHSLKKQQKKLSKIWNQRSRYSWIKLIGFRTTVPRTLSTAESDRMFQAQNSHAFVKSCHLLLTVAPFSFYPRHGRTLNDWRDSLSTANAHHTVQLRHQRARQQKFTQNNVWFLVGDAWLDIRYWRRTNPCHQPQVNIGMGSLPIHLHNLWSASDYNDKSSPQN